MPNINNIGTNAGAGHAGWQHSTAQCSFLYSFVYTLEILQLAFYTLQQIHAAGFLVTNKKKYKSSLALLPKQFNSWSIANPKLVITFTKIRKPVPTPTST